MCQTQAISWVESMLWVLAPRQDMAGYQQFRNGVVGNTTPAVVGGKHTLSKESLTKSSLGSNDCFCRSSGFNGRMLNDTTTWSDILYRSWLQFHFSAHPEQFLQLFFTGYRKSFPISSE